MTALDISKQLVLRGISDENVPSILTQFRKSVELKSYFNTLFIEINKRAIRFFPLIFKGVGLDIYSQLLLGPLEGRSENALLTELRLRQADVITVAAQTWSDWVDASTGSYVCSSKSAI